jgi:hypothetical protein
MSAINEHVDPLTTAFRFLNETTKNLEEKQKEESSYSTENILKLGSDEQKVMISKHTEYRKDITGIIKEVSKNLENTLSTVVKPEAIAGLKKALNVTPKDLKRDWKIGSEATKALGILQTVQTKLEDIKKEQQKEQNIIG